MKNIFKRLSVLAIFAVAFASCDEDKTAYEALEFPNDSFVALNGTSFDILEASSNDVTITLNRATSTAGAQSELVVPFTVTTNAVAGVDYEIVDNKSSFTFAAGEFTDSIVIKTIDNSEEDGDKKIVITLADGAGIGFPGDAGNGTEFTVNISDDDCAFTLEQLGQASWSGSDNVPASQAGPNDSQIETSYDGTNLLLEGIGYGWMTDTAYWNEPVVVSYKVVTQVDLTTGAITIAEQPLCETTYLGDPQAPYSVVGSGQYTSCSKTMVINYDLIQNGGVLRSFSETITF